MRGTINIIGAGLAGCEAALQAASRNIHVRLYDIKPDAKTPAHSFNGFAELVCSNSLKSTSTKNASGILKNEMAIMDSIVMEAAFANRVDAGGALAVDREAFSGYITEKILENENIEFICREVTGLSDDDITIIATGPLTTDGLLETIGSVTGTTGLFFFDAAAPIVYADTIDMSKVFFGSRYGKGGEDYINCPMDRVQYFRLMDFLLSAERKDPAGFERNHVFEGCMPVEVMALRGIETIRHGPMKPVGLDVPGSVEKPYAVVQLRAENKEKTMYNMVGFQTNLRFKEQRKMLSLIPGLENAGIARYGVMHRNSYIDSPRLLGRNLSLLKKENIFFAGQITGTEGYLESASSGILAGINAAFASIGEKPPEIDARTMIGALLEYITNGGTGDFQPMNANFGILRGPEEYIRDREKRKTYLYERSDRVMREYRDKVIKAFGA